MNWIKRKIKAAWHKTKLWVLALLASLGIIVGAYAETKDFTWSNPTFRTDGSAFDAATEQLETRLYCDGDAAIVIPNGPTSYSGDFGIGSHTCYATAVDTDGQESDPSNDVTFDVLPARPNPPTLQVN